MHHCTTINDISWYENTIQCYYWFKRHLNWKSNQLLFHRSRFFLHRYCIFAHHVMLHVFPKSSLKWFACAVYEVNKIHPTIHIIVSFLFVRLQFKTETQMDQVIIWALWISLSMIGFYSESIVMYKNSSTGVIHRTSYE